MPTTTLPVGSETSEAYSETEPNSQTPTTGSCETSSKNSWTDLQSPPPKKGTKPMLKMSWWSPTPEDASYLARQVADLVRAAKCQWEGLPLWETCFHVTCKKSGEGGLVTVSLWPQPDPL